MPIAAGTAALWNDWPPGFTQSSHSILPGGATAEAMLSNNHCSAICNLVAKIRADVFETMISQVSIIDAWHELSRDYCVCVNIGSESLYLCSDQIVP